MAYDMVLLWAPTGTCANATKPQRPHYLHYSFSALSSPRALFIINKIMRLVYVRCSGGSSLCCLLGVDNFKFYF